MARQQAGKIGVGHALQAAAGGPQQQVAALLGRLEYALANEVQQVRVELGQHLGNGLL